MPLKLFAMFKPFAYLVCLLSFTGLLAQSEIIYTIHQRSFFDSNADGNGDFTGIKQKLDYLQSFGVTTIQLAPVYRLEDKKSDANTAFEKFMPQYGTFKEYIGLVNEVHRRSMKIYFEFEMDYLQTAISKNEDPKVKNNAIKGLTYWADPNKDKNFYDAPDGFVFTGMADKLNPTDKVSLFKELWLPLITSLKKINPKLQVITYPADKNSSGYEYFEKAGVDVVYSSKLQQAITTFNKRAIIAAADSAFVKLSEAKHSILYIEDQNTGRIAGKITNVKKLQAATALTMLMGAGIPSIHYGQEIGMKGGLIKAEDGTVQPFPEAFEWYKDDNGAGIAYWYKNIPALWNARAAKPADGISLEEEQADANSLFKFYISLYRLNALELALKDKGVYKDQPNDNDDVISFTRSAKVGEVLVVINLSDKPQVAMLENTGEVKVDKLKLLMGDPKVVFPRGGRTLSLPPYTVQVWRVLH